jgi:hypothetical protein
LPKKDPQTSRLLQITPYSDSYLVPVSSGIFTGSLSESEEDRVWVFYPNCNVTPGNIYTYDCQNVSTPYATDLKYSEYRPVLLKSFSPIVVVLLELRSEPQG